MRRQFLALSQNIVVEIDPVQYARNQIVLFGLIGIQCFAKVQQLRFLHGKCETVRFDAFVFISAN